MIEDTTPVVNTTCAFCDEANTYKTCIKCHRFYCIEHSSRISPQLCKDCFASVSVTIDKYTKVTEEYDASSDTIEERKTSCKRIRLDGPDYVWYSVAIQQAQDHELGEIIEFHKFMVSLIESLKTTREVEKNRLLREQKLPGSLTTSTETITKTRTRKSVKQQKTPREILAMSGITETTPGFASLLAQLEAAAKK